MTLTKILTKKKRETKASQLRYTTYQKKNKAHNQTKIDFNGNQNYIELDKDITLDCNSLQYF